MGELPFALALTAGTLAAVNPCGFALLPVYASFLVLGDDAPGRLTALGRALVLTLAMTTGFVAVFGVFGLAVAPVAGAVQQHLPWFTIGFGLLLVGLGGWLLAGRPLPTPRIRAPGSRVTRSVPSMAMFGVAYALASLGCTIGPFLALVVASFRADSLATGIGLFGAYALGMGLVIGTVSVAMALARSSVVGALRQAGPLVSRMGGLLLLVAGGYVAYYGWYEIRVLRGDTTGDPVVAVAGGIQRWLADIVQAAGLGGTAGAFALLLAGALALAWARRRHSSRGGEEPRRLAPERR